MHLNKIWVSVLFSFQNSRLIFAVTADCSAMLTIQLLSNELNVDMVLKNCETDGFMSKKSPSVILCFVANDLSHAFKNFCARKDAF